MSYISKKEELFLEQVCMDFDGWLAVKVRGFSELEEERLTELQVDIVKLYRIVKKLKKQRLLDREKSKQGMRKFRSTPEGWERSKKVSRESARRKRQRERKEKGLE